MTEDQNEQTTGQEPVGDPSPTAATPAVEGTDAAIPMPAASTTEPGAPATPAAKKPAPPSRCRPSRPRHRPTA